MSAQLHEFYEQLKRRRVIRVATLYVVVFWPIIQVADILSPALNLPETGMRYLVFAFVAGFPVVLVLAWIFDLNANGIVRDSGETGHRQTGIPLIGSRLELAIIFIMLLVVGGVFYLQMNLGHRVGTTPAEAIASVTPPGTATSEARLSSIAVLPFDTFSQESRDRYFADGLTEELLNVLSRIKGLKVAARTSSFAYRDVSKTVQQIGKELGVDAILEGSVRRNDIDNTIRVTAQLVNTRTGTHFWSRTFDRQFKDVFKIQDEISAAVVDQLKVTMLGDTAGKLKSRHSVDPEAMITYSMGQTELAKRTRVALGDAVRYFQRSLDTDPQYAEAWVGLADANSLLASYGWGDFDGHLKQARTAVDKALAIDPGLGKAWASQGLIFTLEGKHEQALASLRKAIAENPNYAMAHMWYGGLLEDQQAQLKEYERAYELDPRSPVAGFNVANIFLAQGREAEAMQVFNNIVEADPYYPHAYELVARVSARRGRLDSAIRQYEKAYKLQPDAGTAVQIAQLETSLGNFDAADAWTARARPDASPDQLAWTNWLDAQRFVMQGRLDAARDVIRKLETPWDDSRTALLVSAYAAYFLGDDARAIESWNRLGVAGKEKRGADKDQLQIYNAVRIAVAWAYRRTGDVARANQLLDETGKDLDEKVHSGSDSDPGLWYNYALIKASRGNTRLALMDLQRAVDEGWHDYWQPQLDPPLAPLLDDAEFKGMMAGVESRLNLIRNQITFEKSFVSSQEKPAPGS